MGTVTMVIAFSAILFCAMIINLAAKPKFAVRLTGIAVLVTAIGGLLMYGYGFSVVAEGYLAIIRTTLAVCGMFVGKNDFAVMKEVPFFQNPAVECVFWIIHLFALYATASAAIVTVGGRLLKKLKLWLIKRGNLVIIYGVNEETIEFGQQMVSRGEDSILFVDPSPTPNGESAVMAMGCVLCSDSTALIPDKKFLRSIGAKRGKRKIQLYALDKDRIQNVEYAKKLLRAFQAKEIDAAQTSLVLQEEDEEIGILFQASGEHYGYGSVAVVSQSGMVARLLVQKYPPCRTLHFDEQARATEDFEALIVGFGKIGQAVLRQLVMNSQFEGSHFHVGIFAPNCHQVKGFMAHDCKAMLDNYDIQFFAEDARSGAMYDYLWEHRQSLKYIVLCTGNEKLNEEIECEIKKYLSRVQNNAEVYRCSYSGIYSVSKNVIPTHYSVYSPEVLCFGEIDKRAIALNNYYCKGNPEEASSNWAKCDYFSRMSNRAAADFQPAMKWALGEERTKGLREGKNVDEQTLENLGRTEHLRWCAFHFCMGFDTMDEKTYAERAAQYQQEVEQNGASKLRIGKDLVGKKHACLIPWEELSTLSARENAITGGNVDYEAMEMMTVLDFLRGVE